MSAADHVLNQGPVHGGLFDDDCVRWNRFVERLAEPTPIHRRVVLVLHRVTLQHRHLFVMFFPDAAGPFLIGGTVSHETFRCLNAAEQPGQRRRRRRNQSQIYFVPPEGKPGVGIFVAQENDLGAGFRSLADWIPGRDRVGDQHQVGRLNAPRIVREV
ncbi:MAG: hypothetical protein E6J89_03515 [Deltaproteobacteria bacterium]|nr:MAG: hypothetical protein E6J89_03515 [Deltaproteobacteria bacterium]